MTGTLSYGELSALRPSLADDSAMVTWIAPVGSTVERGEPLYALDGQPTILFYGSVPQHRTLRFDPERPSPVWVELEQAETAVEAAELTLEPRRGAARGRRGPHRRRHAPGSTMPFPRRRRRPSSSSSLEPCSAAEAKLGRVRELSAAELAPTIDIAAAEAELATARAIFDAAIRALRKDLCRARGSMR